MRTKLKLTAAAVQIPLGLEGDLVGLVDLVGLEAVYFEGPNGWVPFCHLIFAPKMNFTSTSDFETLPFLFNLVVLKLLFFWFFEFEGKL